MRFRARSVPAIVLIAAVGCFGGPPGPDDPTETGTLDTRDGVRLRWESYGWGADTVLIPFAHVLADPLRPLRRDGRTLIFYDVRGRGRSDAVQSAERLGVDLEVRDIEDVRRHFGIESIDLIGYAYLGAVAARYAAENPERVRRLVLMAPFPPRAPHPASTPLEELAALRDSAALERLQEMDATGRAVLRPESYCRSWWLAQLPAYVSPATDLTSLRPRLDFGCGPQNESIPNMLFTVHAVLGDWTSYDLRPEARAITSPTLVVHGADDRIAPPEGGREWADQIPGARFVEIPDAGHLLWAERPEALREAVDRFLAGN